MQQIKRSRINGYHCLKPSLGLLQSGKIYFGSITESYNNASVKPIQQLEIVDYLPGLASGIFIFRKRCTCSYAALMTENGERLQEANHGFRAQGKGICTGGPSNESKCKVHKVSTCTMYCNRNIKLQLIAGLPLGAGSWWISAVYKTISYQLLLSKNAENCVCELCAHYNLQPPTSTHLSIYL